ncbi:MAG: hypothetical protein ACP5KJ_04190, partial [Candidatus Micrarchaeia archaeon]
MNKRKREKKGHRIWVEVAINVSVALIGSSGSVIYSWALLDYYSMKYGSLCCLGPGVFVCLIWLACFYGIRDLADAYFYGVSDVSIPRSLNKIGFYLIALYFFFYWWGWLLPMWVFSYNAIYSFAILLFGCM